MQRLTAAIFGLCSLAWTGTCSAQIRKHVEKVEFNLGSVEVSGACPSVPTYGQQLRQGRALSWQAGRADVDVKLFVNQPVGDRKSRLQLRDCAANAVKALPKEQLTTVTHDSEKAVMDLVNQCLKGAGSDLTVVDASLRRSSLACGSS